MEQQIRDIGGVLFHVIRDMIVFGATGFVIGLLLRKTVKEASERLIKTIEFFTEDTRKNIEKLVESMEGLADHTRKNSERLMESITEFIEHTGKSVADDVATRRTLASRALDLPIFVGNLALTTTEEDLRQLFEPYGTVVTLKIMTDRETGRSRGFGFVEMADRQAAHTAIERLHGRTLAGRALTVQAARPREPRRAPRW